MTGTANPGTRPPSTLARFAWVPLVLMACATLWFYHEDSRAVYAHPRLLFSMMFIFSTLVSVVIAILAGRTYLVSGQSGMMLLGCGALVWGSGGMLATIIFSRDINFQVTVYNLAALLSSMLHLAGALSPLQARGRVKFASIWLDISYAIALGGVLVIFVLAHQEWLPKFFQQGQGGTPIRQIVLGSAIVLFTMAAVILWRSRNKVQSGFYRWYSCGLGLLAIGLLGVMLQDLHSSALGWVGRATQSLGGVYMLIGAIVAVRESRSWQISLTDALEDAKEQYELLFHSSNDGILLHELATDKTPQRIVQANKAVCRLLGYRHEEICQLHLEELFVSSDRSGVTDSGGSLARSGELVHEDMLLTKDGRRIPTEVSSRLFQHKGQKMVISIIRDITERKRAEKALEASEQRFRSLVDDSCHCVWRLTSEAADVDAGCAAWWCGFTGQSEEKRVASGHRGWLQAVHREDREQAMKGWRLIVETEGPWCSEFRVRRHDDVWRWLRVAGKIVRDDSGEVLERAGTISDITEQKLAEQESHELDGVLQAKLDEMKTLLDLLPVGVWVGNADCSQITGNRAAYEIMGLQHGINASVTANKPEVPPVRIYLDGREVPPSDAPMQQVARTGKPLANVEHEIVFPDGARKPVYASIAPLFGKEGSVRGVIGAYVDFSDRKRAEHALRESEERFRVMAEAAPVMIWMSDTDKRCTYVNQQWLNFTGRSLEEELRVSWEEGVHPDDLKMVVECYGKAFDAKEVFSVEFRYRRHDGVYRWCMEQAVPRFTRDREFVGYIGSCIDITERKESEQQLARLNQELETRVAMRTADLERTHQQLQVEMTQRNKLAAEMAHAVERERLRLCQELHEGLAQQLAGIGFMIASAPIMPGKPAAKTDLDQAKRLQQMITDCIEQIRDLALGFYPVDMEKGGLLIALQEVAYRTQKFHNIDCSVEADGAADQKLPAEMEIQLFRIAQEAVRNAVKHSKGKEVHIEMEKNRDQLCLIVRDDGVGFLPEMNRFKGLGLKIMEYRAETINGKLEYGNADKGGATVSCIVELPRADVSAA